MSSFVKLNQIIELSLELLIKLRVLLDHHIYKIFEKLLKPIVLLSPPQSNREFKLS